MLAPDGTLQGHYRITYVVEERPDCVLYRAIDQRESLRVLIAALPQPNQEALEEVQALARQIVGVQTPGLLALHDHFADGLTCYLVADDPGGQDLDRVARERGGPMGEEEVLRHIERLLAILDTLHNRKPPLLLGDLRSTDIWSSPDGDLSLAPFVLARHIGNEPSSYRAPELSDPNNQPTTSSDLYALGAVQYQLITGWTPPTAEVRLAGTPLNSPRTLNGRVSILAEQMMLRSLELKPVNRYQLAREMRSALETVRLMGGRPLGATAPIEQPVIVPAAAAAPQSQPSGPETPRPQPPAGVYGPPPPAAPFPGGGMAQPGTPAPQPAPTVSAPGYGSAQYGQPAAPARRPQINNGCLIAAVVVLGLISLAICVIGLYIAYLLVTNPTGGLPFMAPAGNAFQATPLPAATVPAEPAAPSPTRSATPEATAAAGFVSTRQLTETAVGASLFSPDGRYLAVAVGNAIRLYDGASLELRETLSGHSGEVSALAFTPANGPILLASGSSEENSIRLWELGTGQQIALLEGHEGWIRGLAFSPDGSLLASSSTDTTARVWDVAARSSIHQFAGHSDWLGNVAFSPDGTKLVSASRDGTLRLWDVATGQAAGDLLFTAPVDPNSGAPYWLTGVAFSPDGRTIAAGSTSGNAYLVDAASGQLRRALEGHSNWIVIRGVSFSPDGRSLATASLDGTVRLWNPSSGAEQATLERSGLRLLSVAWDGEGARLVTSSDMGGVVTIWDAANRQISNSLQIGQGTVTALAYSDDGNLLASGGASGTVVLHLLSENEKIILNGGAPTSQYLAFLSDTDLVALSSEGNVVLIDLSRQGQSETFEGLDGVALSVAATLNRRVLAAGNEQGEVAIWDVESRKLLRTLRGLRGPVYNLSFSRDGNHLAAVSNDPADSPVIALWDTTDGQLLQRFEGHSGPITGLSMRADGERLASTSTDGTLRIWDGTNGQTLHTIASETDQGWYSSTAFSPDGAVLAVGTMGGRVEFYNGNSGDLLYAVELNSSGVLALAFRLDGSQLAVSTRDGGVWLLERAD